MADPLRQALESGEWIGTDLRELYDKAIVECALKVMRYNSTVMDSRDALRDALEDIICQPVDGSTLVLFPFRCDLGFNIRLGKDVLVNYNCTFLDTAPITVGDHTKIGPDCHLVTAVHPMDHLERRTHTVKGNPITIGEDCWIGANVTILPGVRIGDRCIIGAGSVVTHDVPDDSVVAGNPAHDIGKKDRLSIWLIKVQ